MLEVEEGAEKGILWWASGDEHFVEDGESMGAVPAQQAGTEGWAEDGAALQPLQGLHHPCMPSAASALS